jgi:hypothetical protein
MSYRNDQDAALARRDALEVEYAQLFTENLRLRAVLASRERTVPDVKPPMPSERDPAGTVLCVILGLTLGLVLLALIWA